MEKLTLDSEAAQKIVFTFQQLKSLENALNKEPFSQLREILGSASELNQSMNLALHQSCPRQFKSHLNELIVKAETHKNSLIQVELSKATDEIKTRLDQILDNLSQLKSKITIEHS